jgi:hypothetical protein
METSEKKDEPVVENEIKECVCMKCNEKFMSADELDQDGDGKCDNCKKSSAEIAKKIDADFAERRKNRPAPMPVLKEKSVYFEQDGHI